MSLLVGRPAATLAWAVRGLLHRHAGLLIPGSHQVGKPFTFKVKDFTAAADSFRRLPCNRQVTVQSPSNQSNQKVFLCDF